MLGTSHTYRVTKVINAPIAFVYKWCTDYREDDSKIVGSRTRRIILQKNRRRVVFTTTQRHLGKMISTVRIVTLHPQNAWHLEKLGDEVDEIGNYHLTRLGPRKTRLNMVFNAKYKVANASTSEEDAKEASRVWEKFKAALEEDYARTK